MNREVMARKVREGNLERTRRAIRRDIRSFFGVDKSEGTQSDRIGQEVDILLNMYFMEPSSKKSKAKSKYSFDVYKNKPIVDDKLSAMNNRAFMVALLKDLQEFGFIANLQDSYKEVKNYSFGDVDRRVVPKTNTKDTPLRDTPIKMSEINIGRALQHTIRRKMEQSNVYAKPDGILNFLYDLTDMAQPMTIGEIYERAFEAIAKIEALTGSKGVLRKASI